MNRVTKWMEKLGMASSTLKDADVRDVIKEHGETLKTSFSADMTYAKSTIDLDFPHFAAVLPYRYFCSERDLFINESSLGFGLELAVLSGADEKLITSISDLLRYKVRDKYDIQFLFWGSNQVGDIIDRAYQKQGMYNPSNEGNKDKVGDKGDIHARLAEISAAYYKKGAESTLKNKRNLPVTLRDYRLFLFLSKNTAYSEKAVVDIEHAREEILAELKAADIGCIYVKIHEFLSLMRSIINPEVNNIYTRPGVHEEHTTVNEQVVDKSFELIHDPERLTVSIDSLLEDRVGRRALTKITNLSLRNLPDRFALWMFPDNFFNVFRASQAISCPFLISMSARLIPQLEAKNKAQSRYLNMEKKARSVYAKYISGTQETASEWKKIRDDLATDEIRLAECYFNVVLFSEDGREKRDTSAAISCFRHNGIELFNTKYMQLQSFLATLPFLMSEGMRNDLKRAGRLTTLTTWNLANLIPIVGEYKMGSEGVLLNSFRNQISFFDIYSDLLPTANYNIAVAATSGAGKSFLVQVILNYVLSISGKCFVIDLGRSYHKTCEMLGGTYLDYESLHLNPFTNIHDISEYSEQIRDLLSVLASPSGGLDDVQEEYLREAAMLAWKNKGNDANIDTVIAALCELNNKKVTGQKRNMGSDARIDDLITLLAKYSTTGAYPEIFNAYSAISKDASLVVLELGELENKPALLKAVLFALMLNIEEEMYQSPRNQPKMVVIDEAWRLLAGDNKAAARFIEKGYRTARRHMGSFVTITQGIEDFLKSDEAKACWNCSDAKIIMLQNAKAFDDFMLKHEGYFDPYIEGLIRNFKEAKTNGFSEFMLQLGKVQSFNRLFVDPFSRIMFSSSGKDVEAVNAERAKGHSIEESIMNVAHRSAEDVF